MIRIAIVDDNDQMRNIIKKYVTKAIHETASMEIQVFSNAESFIEDLENHEYDILFSDIQMDEINGLELGKQIRKIQPDMYIVFITAYTEYAAESYVIDAYQYILKSDLECRLPVIVKRLVETIENENHQYRMIGTGASKERIYYKDIIYIYKIKASKYVGYVTNSDEKRERITIDQLSRELQGKEFVMVDRGLIVNLDHICKISGNVIYLDEDRQIKISRSKIADVKRAMSQYWRAQ